MALETIGLLVNIAGDAGSLVNAVKGAESAFKNFQSTATNASVTAMPAYQRLQAQIDAVTARTSIAARQQKVYGDSMKESASNIEKINQLIQETNDDLQKNIADYGKAEVNMDKYNERMSHLNLSLTQQQRINEKSTKGFLDYGDKIEAAKARTAKLTTELNQVKGPQSKWEAFFEALKSGVGVFNSISGVAGKVMSLFGGAKGGMSGDMSFDKSVEGMLRLSTNTDKASASNTKFSISSAAMSVAMGAGVLAANAITAAISMISNAASQAIGSLISLGQNAITTAGRTNEMAMVAQYMGQQAGNSSEKINEVTTALQKSGANMQTSYDIVTQFSRANLNLAQSTDLLKVAQGAAIVAGQGTSEVTSQLISGIITLQPEVLRTAGIIVSADVAYKKYAESIHTSASALTGQQKQQAILNATLEEGAKLNGLYDEAMKLPGKQLRSITDRLIPDLITVIGGPFQSAFGNVVTTISDFLKALTASAKDANQLGKILSDLGGIADLVSGIFKKTIESNLNVGQNAFDWGHNLIVQFANGIVDGISAVMDALNAVASVVTNWLQPGSPPKLLPNIDKWGEGAMKAYMSGWTDYDFSEFDTISNKLEGFIKSIDQETIGKTNIVPMIINMRSAVAEAIDEISRLGDVTPSTLNKVSSGFGTASDNIQNYVKALLDSSLANKKLQVAQDELNAVTKKYDDQLSQLNDQLKASDEKKTQAEEDTQIKALQRVLSRTSSTDKQKAAAQAELDDLMLRRKIRNTESDKDAAVKASKVKVDAAAAEQKAANERLAVQQHLLDLQQKNNDLIKEAADLAKDAADKTAEALKGGLGSIANAVKGAGGGGGFKAPSFDIKTPDFIKDLQPKLDAIGSKWNTFVGYMTTGFASIKKWATDTWTNTVLPALQNFWAWTQANIIPLWNQIWDIVQKGVAETIPQLVAFWNGTLMPAFQSGGDWFKNELIPIISNLWDWFKVALPGALQSMSEIWNTVVLPAVLGFSDWFITKGLPVLDALFDKTKKDIPDALNFLSFVWEQILLPAIRAVWKFITISLFPLFKDFQIFISSLFQSTLDTLKSWWDLFMLALQSLISFWNKDLMPAFTSLGNFISITLIPAITDLVSWIQDKFLSGLKTLADFVNGGLTKAFDGFKGLIEGVGQRLSEALGFVTNLISSIKNIPGVPSMGSSTGTGNARALGGPVTAGELYLVGEKGPELYRPKFNGDIFTNSETQSFFRNTVSAKMPPSIINSGNNRSSVNYTRNNYLNVNSSTPSQGLVADWGRLSVLGA
jgi:hypothetical protein